MDDDERQPGPLSLSRRAALRRALGSGVAAVMSCVAVDPAAAGYGRCMYDNCAGFQEDYNNREVCMNCGHNYQSHW